MTHQEYFEAWLTPKEWATWKKHSLPHFMRRYGVSYREAKVKRKEYLNYVHDYSSWHALSAGSIFSSMIDGLLTWRDTPQGREYWAQVYERRAPIRTLTH